MTEVRDRILNYNESNPTASLRSIGKAGEISHEYVRIVLKSNGISTLRIPRLSCNNQGCTNRLSTYQKKHTKMCTSCRKAKILKE